MIDPFSENRFDSNKWDKRVYGFDPQYFNVEQSKNILK